MIEAVRRGGAAVALGALLSLGVAVPALAATPSPTPAATASATATGGAATDGTGADADADSPDVAPDNSRSGQAVLVAGGVSLLAAVIVFLRRR